MIGAWLMGCGLKLTTLTVEDETETVVPGASILEQALGGLGFDGWTDMDIVDQEELANQGVEAGGRRPNDDTTVRASTVLEVGVTTRGVASAAEGR